MTEPPASAEGPVAPDEEVPLPDTAGAAEADTTLVPADSPDGPSVGPPADAKHRRLYWLDWCRTQSVWNVVCGHAWWTVCDETAYKNSKVGFYTQSVWTRTRNIVRHYMFSPAARFFLLSHGKCSTIHRGGTSSSIVPDHPSSPESRLPPLGYRQQQGEIQHTARLRDGRMANLRPRVEKKCSV